MACFLCFLFDSLIRVYNNSRHLFLKQYMRNCRLINARSELEVVYQRCMICRGTGMHTIARAKLDSKLEAAIVSCDARE